MCLISKFFSSRDHSLNFTFFEQDFCFHRVLQISTLPRSSYILTGPRGELHLFSKLRLSRLLKRSEQRHAIIHNHSIALSDLLSYPIDEFQQLNHATILYTSFSCQIVDVNRPQDLVVENCQRQGHIYYTQHPICDPCYWKETERSCSKHILVFLMDLLNRMNDHHCQTCGSEAFQVQQSWSSFMHRSFCKRSIGRPWAFVGNTRA
jgi:hypothetical protein